MDCFASLAMTLRGDSNQRAAQAFIDQLARMRPMITSSNPGDPAA
jgi:hypothetical protein